MISWSRSTKASRFRAWVGTVGRLLVLYTALPPPLRRVAAATIFRSAYVDKTPVDPLRYIDIENVLPSVDDTGPPPEPSPWEISVARLQSAAAELAHGNPTRAMGILLSNGIAPLSDQTERTLRTLYPTPVPDAPAPPISLGYDDPTACAFELVALKSLIFSKALQRALATMAGPTRCCRTFSAPRGRISLSPSIPTRLRAASTNSSSISQTPDSATSLSPGPQALCSVFVLLHSARHSPQQNQYTRLRHSPNRNWLPMGHHG